MIEYIETLLELFHTNNFELVPERYPYKFRDEHGAVFSKRLEDHTDKSILLRVATGIDLEELSFHERFDGKIRFTYGKFSEVIRHHGEERRWFRESTYLKASCMHVFRHGFEIQNLGSEIAQMMRHGFHTIKTKESRNTSKDWSSVTYLLDDAWIV
jgi:hypothetical protein